MGAEILAENCELTLGSASAIFAAGMAKLGHRVTFVSQVGRDNFGDFCIKALKHLGVSTRNVIRKAKEKTGVTLALSGNRDRALVTYTGAIATFTADRVNDALMRRHGHLHLTSYYLQTGLRPSFPAHVSASKSAGLTTSLTPIRIRVTSGITRSTAVLKFTDVLFVNEREAMKLTRYEHTERCIANVLAQRLTVRSLSAALRSDRDSERGTIQRLGIQSQGN